MGRRLSQSALPAESKQPVILPKQSHVATLVLRNVHEARAHAGRNHMLAKLKRKVLDSCYPEAAVEVRYLQKIAWHGWKTVHG